MKLTVRTMAWFKGRPTSTVGTTMASLFDSNNSRYVSILCLCHLQLVHFLILVYFISLDTVWKQEPGYVPYSGTITDPNPWFLSAETTIGRYIRATLLSQAEAS